MKYLPALLSAALVLGVPAARACPVCFGAQGDPVTEAAGTSILFLLVFVVALLGGVIAFFYTLLKRSSEHQTLVDALGYDPEA